VDAEGATAVRTAVAEQEALISGSEAVAVASKLADVDVITAYPIRPYDTMMQFVAKQIANGEQDAEYNQRCGRNLESAHENQGAAEPQVLLEAGRAANNVREREVCQAQPPISIRHRS